MTMAKDSLVRTVHPLKDVNKSDYYFVCLKSCTPTDEDSKNTSHCPAPSGITSYHPSQNLVCYLHAFLNNACSSVCLILDAHG